MRQALFFFTLLACAASALAASAVASESFSSADGSRFQQLAISHLSSNQDVAVAAAAASVLSALKATDKAPSGACDSIKKQLSSSDVLVLKSAVPAALSLKCGGVETSSLKDAINQGLKADNIAAIAAAGQVIASLVDAGKAQWKDFSAVSTAIDTVLSLSETDGTYKPRPGSDGNPLAAGTALEFLGKAYAGASEDQQRKIKAALSTLETLLELGTADDDDLISFRGSASRSGVAVTAQVLRGVLAVLKAAPSTKFDASYFERIGAWIVTNKYTSSIEDAAEVIRAINALSSSASGVSRVPLALTIEGNAVKVTNLLGSPIQNAKVSLTRATDQTGAAVKGKDGSLSSSGNGAFALPSFSAGVYKLSLSVETESKQSAKVTRSYAVTRGAPTLGSCEVQIYTDAAASDAQTLKAQFPNAASGSLKATKEHSLRVKVSVDDSFAASQSVVTFARRDNGATTSLPLIREKNTLQASLDLGRASSGDYFSGTGEYSVGVLIGDATLSKPVSWTCATVHITVGDSSSAAAAAERAEKLASSLKEIQYQFRPAEKRPNALIALIFAGLAILPLLGFFKAVQHIGINLRLPRDGALSSMVFQLSILAILLVIVRYWLGLNILQGIWLLSGVCIVALFSGNFALRASAEEEEAEAKKNA